MGNEMNVIFLNELQMKFLTTRMNGLTKQNQFDTLYLLAYPGEIQRHILRNMKTLNHMDSTEPRHVTVLRKIWISLAWFINTSS